MNLKTEKDVKQLAFEAWNKEQGNDNDSLDFDDENTVTDGNAEYIVLTDDEANQMASDYIKDSVWAFNKSFLDCHSEAISAMDEETYKVIQERCESSNKAVWAMIDDKDHFIDDAIASDGRGHFLSSYDGNEHEIAYKGTYYFIYRTN